MGVESKFSKVAPPIFDGEIYDLRAVRVRTCLKDLEHVRVEFNERASYKE